MNYRISVYLLFYLLLQVSATVQVLDFSTNIVVDGDELHVVRSYTINVNNSNSRELGDISISKQKHSKFKLIEAAIYNDKGERLHSIKKRDIQTVSLRNREAFSRILNS